MAARLINGDEVAGRVLAGLAVAWKNFIAQTNQVPVLAALAAGEPAFFRLKLANLEKLSKRYGFPLEVRRLPGNAGEDNILEAIRQLNADARIGGIVVLRPLPENVNAAAIAAALDPEKDVAGIHPLNMGKLFDGESGYLPAAAASIMETIVFTGQPFHGKTAAVIGGGSHVVQPLALMLLRRNVSVSICHVGSDDLADICRQADILVLAAEEPRLLKADRVKPGATVIALRPTKNDDLPPAGGEAIPAGVGEKAGWVALMAEEAVSFTAALFMKKMLGLTGAFC